jgi:2'-5' RNA ligase
MIPLLAHGDYRIFVGAFPAGSLAEEIQAIRERYDAKTARITPPHVTLAGTYWRLGEAVLGSETAVIDQLQLICGQIRPFSLVLGGIRTFGWRVAYLGVESTEEIRTVRRTLVQCLSQDKHQAFNAHLTLAMRLKKGEMQNMVAELQKTGWENGRFVAPITHLQLMQRGANDPAWREIGRFALGGELRQD